MKRLLIKYKKRMFLLLVLILGLSLRVYGLNWDQGFHLHPDERFLTMVGTTIRWPSGLGEYLNTSRSPLNPYNNDYDFFVYGPLPLFLTKVVAGVFNLDQYSAFNLVGRVLSALADSGVIIFLFLISKDIWASLLYSLMVLPIQLSHFFSVDTFLNFFLVLSFWAAFNRPIFWSGIFLGLALSSKVTAVLFSPVILLILFSRFRNNREKLALNISGFFLAAFLSFRFFSPYVFSSLFSPNHQFLDNLKTLKSFDHPDAWYPPGIQWIKTKPIIFPGKNLLIWGLGIPLSVLVIIAVFRYCQRLIKRKRKDLFHPPVISLFWIFFLFIFQGVQFVKTMRYFLPIYPFLALIAGQFLGELSKKIRKRFLILILVPLFIYPFSFLAIYSRSHSRVSASEWIFDQVPSGSVLSCEHWDDCLPLPIKPTRYRTEMLHLYDRDDRDKWLTLSRQLEKVDYLILSSNRLWGSIPKVPERYPRTAKFYQDLFGEKLGFKKLIEFTSYPSFLGVSLVDDSAEEAFTVYDHPKVMIFFNQERFSSQEIFRRVFATD